MEVELNSCVIMQPKLPDKMLSCTYFGQVQRLYNKTLGQRLHVTGSVWSWHEIGTDEPCVYTRPGGSGTDRICSLVPNGSTYEGDPMWDRTVRTGPV